MITCTFENGHTTTSLRHVVLHALVEREKKLLVVKRAPGLLEAGKWSLPGGFLDRGETAGQGVLRELKEETGWSGEVLSLFRINTNPNRPHEDRQNIAFDFIVRPRSLDGTPDHESTEIAWMPIDTLIPTGEFAFDHGESIKQYLRYRLASFPLPIII